MRVRSDSKLLLCALLCAVLRQAVARSWNQNDDDVINAAMVSRVSVEPYFGSCGHPDSEQYAPDGDVDHRGDASGGYGFGEGGDYYNYDYYPDGVQPNAVCSWRCSDDRSFPTNINRTRQTLLNVTFPYPHNGGCWRGGPVAGEGNTTSCSEPQPRWLELPSYDHVTYTMRVKPSRKLVNGYAAGVSMSYLSNVLIVLFNSHSFTRKHVSKWARIIGITIRMS